MTSFTFGHLVSTVDLAVIDELGQGRGDDGPRYLQGATVFVAVAIAAVAFVLAVAIAVLVPRERRQARFAPDARRIEAAATRRVARRVPTGPYLRR